MSFVSKACASSQARATSLARYCLNGTYTFFVPSGLSTSFTLPIGEAIEATLRPYSSSRCRSFWISGSVSFITFFTPLPTSMCRSE